MTDKVRWSINNETLIKLCLEGMEMHDEHMPEYVVCDALLQRLEAEKLETAIRSTAAEFGEGRLAAALSAPPKEIQE